MKKAIELFTSWYSNLPSHKASGGPARGTISAALAVLEKLKEEYEPEIEAHTAKGGAQISGASGQAVKKILAKFGETRPFAKEGGRTNRGGRSDIKKMLDSLKKANLEKLSSGERTKVLEGMQQFLVDRVAEFHNRERVKMSYDPSKSTWQNIISLLSAARETGKEGPVAQHLIGAKL